jgi:hypothetical protein
MKQQAEQFTAHNQETARAGECYPDLVVKSTVTVCSKGLWRWCITLRIIGPWSSDLR